MYIGEGTDNENWLPDGRNDRRTHRSTYRGGAQNFKQISLVAITVVYIHWFLHEIKYKSNLASKLKEILKIFIVTKFFTHDIC